VVFDYGFGNVRSAVNSLIRAGADARISADPGLAAECDGLVVPGVGAFAACMSGLVAAGGPGIVSRRVADGRAVLGICVGMQVLFTAGLEHGHHTAGLGLWPGRVDRLEAPILPHMGWNTVTPAPGSRLFAGVGDERFYFVHSYAARDPLTPASARVTWATHGQRFAAAIEDGPLSATQFHPEKSGDAGLALLRNWIDELR
jgi:imidazole glycerol-phosphate synthase subunit HisH